MVLRASGLVQPILVRRAENRFQLVVGERRWRAAKLAGMETIPAVIRDLGDREALELALTENLLREDLNPIEVAHGLRALQEKHGLTHEEIAGRLGVNRSTVTNTLRLLRLPEEVQLLIEEGKITAGHKIVVVKTPFAKEDSLIYLTPVGPTLGKVLFLANIEPDVGFTVSIDNFVSSDIKFNWWIVN